MSGEWLLAWDDERTTTQAITDQLLKDPVLARNVYNKLHSHYVAAAARDKRRQQHP